jgi:hypothetical protein
LWPQQKRHKKRARGENDRKEWRTIKVGMEVWHINTKIMHKCEILAKKVTNLEVLQIKFE